MAGTIEINGTGGIIEGNLGAANVNVNLDSARLFATADNSGISQTGGSKYTQTNRNISFSCWYKQTEEDKGALFSADNGTQSYKSLWFGVESKNSTENFFRGYLGNGTSYDGIDAYAITKAQAAEWNHYAVTISTGDSTTYTAKMYFNGQLVVTDTSWTKAYDSTARAYSVGDGGGYVETGGYVADWRLYNTELGIDDIKILASKMQVDNSLLSASSNLKVHYKLDGSDISSSTVDNAQGTADYDGTLTGTTEKFDTYSVDVYDGYDGSDATTRTTTDGTFTVTQGKVEGKALSYLHLDETADAGVTANAAGAIDDLTALTKGTISLWTRADNWTGGGGSPDDHWVYSLTDESGASFFGLQTSGWVSPVGRVRCAIYKSGTYQFDLTTDAAVTSLDTWHHIVVTQDGSGPVIYVDGVKPPQTFQNSTSVAAWWDDVDNADYQLLGGGLKYNGAAQAYEPDGDFKDYRFYDYALSAEQVASLYSGSYNVTPNHHIKFDDASVGASGSTGNIADSGTDTAWVMTYTSSDTTNDKIVNGTLDLDGTLTVSANGTLSAPRGDLDLAANFIIAADTSTYTHNNGTFKPSANCELFPADTQSSENERHIFYDVAHTGGTLYLERPCKIENTYTKTGGTLRHYAKVTFGTATSAGTMTINNGNWSFYGYYGSPILQGANQLYPLVVTGSGYSSDGPIDWDTINNEARSPDTFNYIKWIDFQKDMVTGGDGGDAVMLGDCKFAAFTISANDSLNLNGQRAEFSGVLQNSGAIKSTGGGLIIADNNIRQSGSMEYLHDGDVNVIVNGGDEHNWRLGAADGNGPWCRNLLVNGNVTTYTQIGHASGNVNYNVESVIVGNGTLTPADNTYLKDLTVATGGTFLGRSSGNKEIGLHGDFTTSGGLIGDSSIVFDGTDDYIQSGTFADDRNTANNGDYTIEFWFKKTTSAISSGSEYLFDYSTGSNNLNRSFGRLNTSEQLQWLSYTSGGGEHPNLSGNTTGLNDGKWHHAAYVFYGTGGAHTGTYPNGAKAIYLDGKLDGLVEGGHGGATHCGYDQGTDMTFTLGRDEKDDDDYFDGCMDEVRIWSDVRTEAEIRANMFSAVAIDSANLRHYYDCNFLHSSKLEDMATSTTGEAHLEVDITFYGGATYASSGTFDEGTSTLKMTGTDKRWYMGSYNNQQVANFTVDGTITLQSIGYNYGAVYFTSGSSTFTLGASGTLSSHSEESLFFANTGNTIDVSANTDGLANLFEVRFRHSSGNINLPEMTTKYVHLETSGGTVTSTGNNTLTQKLQVDAGTTFIANGNTITAKDVDVNGGTLNLSNSTLAFSSSGSFDLSSSSILLTGNTTINGHSTPTWSSFPQSGGFEVVGDVSNLNIAGGDLTVIGSVTGCTLTGTTTNIRQWHHTLDTQQLLDADEAGDDDLRLTKPALDNALELMTK